MILWWMHFKNVGLEENNLWSLTDVKKYIKLNGIKSNIDKTYYKEERFSFLLVKI